MKTRDLILPVIALYLCGMALFFLEGDSTPGWNVFFYGIEKLFGGAGFFLLALTTHSRYVRKLALYASSLCVFMFLYYIFCYSFGNDSVFGVGAFLMYSLIIVYLLNKSPEK